MQSSLRVVRRPARFSILCDHPDTWFTANVPHLGHRFSTVDVDFDDEDALEELPGTTTIEEVATPGDVPRVNLQLLFHHTIHGTKPPEQESRVYRFFRPRRVGRSLGDAPRSTRRMAPC